MSASDPKNPVPVTTGKRFVPPYYQCDPVSNDAPDALDLIEAMGVDIEQYLVTETMLKLMRYNRKGTARLDITKAIEQMNRLLALVEAREAT